jgi:hypothetical protein
MIPTYVTPVLVTGTVTTIPGSGTQNVNIVSPAVLDVNLVTPNPVPVTLDKAFTASTTAVTVTTASTVLFTTNAARKGIIIQTVQPIFVLLDGSATTSLYSYEVPKKGVVEIENYCGSVTACTASGSTTVLVTEKL